MHARHVLRPRWDLGARRFRRLGAGAAQKTTAPPAISFISRLYRAALMPPVYASQPGLPPNHATLGSGWSPAFAGRESPAGFLCNVSVMSSHGILLAQALPGALSAEAPRAWVGNILTWLQEWADEHGLDLGPDANEPLWDGTRPDYDYAVSTLLAAR